MGIFGLVNVASVWCVWWVWWVCISTAATELDIKYFCPMKNFASYPHDAHSQQILWCQYLHTECILDSNSKGMWLPAFWYQAPTFSMEEKQNHKIPLLFHFIILGIWRTNGISFYKKLPQFVMNPLMKVKEFLLKLPYKAS